MALIHVATDPEGGRIEYRDRKRWLWSMSVLFPLVPFLGIGLHAYTGNELMLLVPLVFMYGVGPFLDWLWGEDENNPPEAVVPQLEEDRYYRVLTYATVPLHFVALIGCAWWVGTQTLSWWGFLVMAVTAGVVSGLGINTGHELGHKRTRLETWLAKIVLAVPAYGHFWIEHNRGHHRDVATPEDPASARMGENIYKFALREVPGAWKRAWALERARLARKGLSVWSTENEILQSYAISAVLQIGLIAAFGWLMVPFLVIHNVLAWWQLTSANYVEHYGLLRAKQSDGKYERCQPWHSWNANYKYTNIVLFHLERHSDHHANPTRRYQSLRHFEHLPRLPNGYYGMYTLAYLPPLWFRVMDPLLLSLKHIDGDLDRVNVDPDHRDAIYARHGQSHKLMGAAA
jgi:alkane 1-monooxygenase